MILHEVLRGLYGSEINVAIKCFWDGGWDIAIGDEFNGFASTSNVDHIEQAAAWFHREAIRLYPESEYAKSAANNTHVAEPFRSILNAASTSPTRATAPAKEGHPAASPPVSQSPSAVTRDTDGEQ